MALGSVLTTALALAALPGIAGSHAPGAMEPVPAGAFQPLPTPASDAPSALSIAGPDRGHRSAAAVHELSTFVDPGDAPEAGPTSRALVTLPEPGSGSERKPAKTTLRGDATFYDHGTTAMRLPRGTVVIICGAGGCLERVVSDYGPVAPGRIVDLYRPDFFKICGCPSWSGVTDVTVYVY